LYLATVEPFETVAREWDDLAEQCNAGPFLQSGWFDAWESAFGRGRLEILAVRAGGRLAGLLPLERRRASRRSPTNPHTPEFRVLAEDEAAAHALGKALFDAGPPYVRLEYLDAEETAFRAVLDAGERAGYRLLVRTISRSPYIVCRASLDEHLRSLSRNLRHDVQRRLRRLGESGAVSLEVHHGDERLDVLLAEGFAIEQSGWKRKRGTAIASDPATRMFYTRVARWAASMGWLRLAFLRLDGRALAFQFDLETATRYYSLKIGYDPAFEGFSPGKLLAHAMVARAVVRGLESYELLGTNEQWKDRWTDDFRERRRIDAFSPSPVGRLAWTAFRHARPSGRAAKRASARLSRLPDR
jgi:CelD/BcsL family acetyltransferase involved in cellulose biosynthesis